MWVYFLFLEFTLWIMFLCGLKCTCLAFNFLSYSHLLYLLVHYLFMPNPGARKLFI